LGEDRDDFINLNPAVQSEIQRVKQVLKLVKLGLKKVVLFKDPYQRPFLPRG
jgi:hypothetical protein